MDTNISGAHTWLILWKASDAMSAFANKSIEDTGLCYTDFGVLEMLLHKGALPVNTIGRKLHLTTGSITTAIDRLVKRGLVERKDDPADKRIRLVFLTDEGRALIEPAFERHARDLDAITDTLSVDEKRTLAALLRKLGKNAAAKV